MNQYFNINRFLNYARYNLIINKKFYLLGITGAIVGLFLVALLMGYHHNLTSVGNWGPFFSASMAIILLPIIGHAFPAFRKKESSITNYMLPCSIFEKFTFEFVMKIIVISGLFLVLFPIISNAAIRMAEFIHTSVHPTDSLDSLKNSEFTYKLLLNSIKNHTDAAKTISIFILLIASIVFSGSAAISKYPLVKTTIFIGLIFLIVLGYFYMMLETFNLNRGIEYTLTNLFPREAEALPILFAINCFTALIALSYAYFKLKEREV